MNHENLKTEKISSLVFKLGVPATIGMLVIAFYNLVDTYFVAGLGVEAVGAATVVFPISMSISSIAFAIGTGTSSYVSRLLGEKDLVKASVVASTSCFTSLLLSALLALLCAFFMKQLLYGFGATASIFEYAY
ncbi:MAG: MATE family efflux transporter, partial [Clostridia bacterium]|nr:MATE family efflux transporter [Clostridia bacterium]